jgi:hypothetical protein
MLRTQYLVLALAFIVNSSLPCAARAAEGCCAGCGCAVPCQKVCRLECGEKKVEVVCWGCKCEDFCIPCKSQCDSEHCETVCQNCGEGEADVCSKPKHFVWYDWCPGCGSVHTKTKLMKKVETVTVPSYKWVVEDLCPQCAANAAAVPGAVVVQSPPPAAEATEEKSILNIVRLPRILSK